MVAVIFITTLKEQPLTAYPFYIYSIHFFPRFVKGFKNFSQIKIGGISHRFFTFQKIDYATLGAG